MAGGDAEQGAEGGVPGVAAVEAEDELVEVGLEMLAAQAVIDAQTPDLKVGEDPVHPQSIDLASYALTDPIVLDALNEAGHRGVGF